MARSAVWRASSWCTTRPTRRPPPSCPGSRWSAASPPSTSTPTRRGTASTCGTTPTRPGTTIYNIYIIYTIYSIYAAVPVINKLYPTIIAHNYPQLCVTIPAILLLPHVIFIQLSWRSAIACHVSRGCQCSPVTCAGCSWRCTWATARAGRGLYPRLVPQID